MKFTPPCDTQLSRSFTPKRAADNSMSLGAKDSVLRRWCLPWAHCYRCDMLSSINGIGSVVCRFLSFSLYNFVFFCAPLNCSYTAYEGYRKEGYVGGTRQKLHCQSLLPLSMVWLECQHCTDERLLARNLCSSSIDLNRFVVMVLWVDHKSAVGHCNVHEETRA